MRGTYQPARGARSPALGRTAAAVLIPRPSWLARSKLVGSVPSSGPLLNRLELFGVPVGIRPELAVTAGTHIHTRMTVIRTHTKAVPGRKGLEVVVKPTSEQSRRVIRD